MYYLKFILQLEPLCVFMNAFDARRVVAHEVIFKALVDLGFLKRGQVIVYGHHYLRVSNDLQIFVGNVVPILAFQAEYLRIVDTKQKDVERLTLSELSQPCSRVRLLGDLFLLRPTRYYLQL